MQVRIGIVVPRKYESGLSFLTVSCRPSAVLSETMICVAPSYARQGVVPFRLQGLDGVSQRVDWV